jgi:hypothetical protein
MHLLSELNDTAEVEALQVEGVNGASWVVCGESRGTGKLRYDVDGGVAVSLLEWDEVLWTQSCCAYLEPE